MSWPEAAVHIAEALGCAAAAVGFFWMIVKLSR